MRKGLKKLHQIGGVVGAVYMLLMALTGTILAFEDQILRLAMPQLETPVSPLTPDEQGVLLESIEARYDAYQLLSIKLPMAGMNAYRVYKREHGSHLLNPHTLQPMDDPIGVDAALQFLFDLHHRFALGHWGEEAVAALGLLALFSVLSGIYLWWPWRRGFRLSLLTPKGGRSPAFRGAHATMGILLAPLLLLVVGTGVGMMYGNKVRPALAVMFGGERSIAVFDAGKRRPADLLKHAGTMFPEAAITLYRPVRAPGAPLGLRLKMPDEWHPNGRTTVTITENGGAAVDATREGLGRRMVNNFYPLHSGKMLGDAYLLLIAVIGLATLYLCLMALLSYRRRQQKKIFSRR